MSRIILLVEVRTPAPYSDEPDVETLGVDEASAFGSLDAVRAHLEAQVASWNERPFLGYQWTLVDRGYNEFHLVGESPSGRMTNVYRYYDLPFTA